MLALGIRLVERQQMTIHSTEFSISTDQLQIGVFVCLDIGWMEHPFSFNNFKIKTDEQLQTIRGLGLAEVRWDPNRSDVKPLPPADSSPEPSANEADVAPVPEPGMAAKQARIASLHQYRKQMLQVERAFTDATASVRVITRNMFAKPTQTVEQANLLIGQMIEALLTAPELAIHVMSEKGGGDTAYFHPLNVSVLAMMLGREMQLPKEQIATVGLASLFHDIGLAEVPAKVMMKAEPLTKPERELRELHCAYGVAMGKKLGLPESALHIIGQHHEYFDGSGYPEQLGGESIDLLSRILCVVNHYDNLCNAANLTSSVTPHEALSLMFSQHRGKFDPKILKLFIRCMGVYPPGTVVRLSNEAMGLVTAVNATKPLKPSVIVYNPTVPKNEAIMIDLERELDINISKAIRPDQLPRAVFEYLNPRKRVSYYFDASSAEHGKNA